VEWRGVKGKLTGFFRGPAWEGKGEGGGIDWVRGQKKKLPSEGINPRNGNGAKRGRFSGNRPLGWKNNSNLRSNESWDVPAE